MRTRQVVAVMRRMLRWGETVWPAACVHWAASHFDRLARRRGLGPSGLHLGRSFRRNRLMGMLVRPIEQSTRATSGRELADQLESRAFAYRHGIDREAGEPEFWQPTTEQVLADIARAAREAGPIFEVNGPDRALVTDEHPRFDNMTADEILADFQANLDRIRSRDTRREILGGFDVGPDIRLDAEIERTRFELRAGRGYGKTERSRLAVEAAINLPRRS